MQYRIAAAWLLLGLVAGLLLTTARPAVAQPKAKPASTADKMSDAGKATDNAATTARVKTALLADKIAPGLKIHVDTNAGVVTLSGQVDSNTEKQRAEQIAKQTKGVKKVINQLTIKPKTPG